MVKIVLLYLTLASCGYIIKDVPEPLPKPEVQQPNKPETVVKPTPPAPAKAKTPEIHHHEPVPPPEIDKHEPVPEKEKQLIPLPPKG